MAYWKGTVNKNFSIDDFESYVESLEWTSWRPSFIVLHNTYIPDLSGYPNGFTKASMRGFVTYYKDDQGWSGGPHLFIDDHNIWVFTPLTVPGVHSPSWNQVALAVEMLGNYDKDKFDTGRGKAVQQNAVAAIAILSSVLGLDPTTMKLHKEDPLTTHKNCPGKNVDKTKFIKKVQDMVLSNNEGDHLKSRTI